MAKNLPQRIEPIRLCERGATLEGELPLKSMSRLTEVLSDKTGQVAVELHFGKDKHGFRVIYGKIAGQMNLVCQRCMQPMDYPVDLTVNLTPVLSETEAARLPKDIETILVTDELISLTELIEDELLLNMPIITKHEEDRCPVKFKDHLLSDSNY